MALIIEYDPATGYIIGYDRSGSQKDYAGETVLINPEFPTFLLDIPRKYWIRDGARVREMTQEEKDQRDAELESSRISTAKNMAKEIQDAQDGQARVIRAIVKLLVDRENKNAQWFMDFKQVIADSSNMADIKTGVAGLPNFTQLTYQDAKAAVTALIEGE